MIRITATAPILLLSACGTIESNSDCVGDAFDDATVEETIELMLPAKDTTSELLYVVKNNYAILVHPDSVLSALRQSKTNSGPDLLALIESDLPLSDNTDLFKYVINDSRFMLNIHYIIADLLENEEAFVIDLAIASEERLQENIVLYKVESGGLIRTFCSSSGRLMFYVVDEVWD